MFKRLCSAVLIPVLALFTASCGDYKYKTYDKQVFGNGITFSASLLGGDADGAWEEMSALMEDINSDMSLTLSSSALSRFNAARAGEEVEISAGTHRVIERSALLYRQTDGAFNIAVAPLTRLWHVDSASLDELIGAPPAATPAPPEYADVLDALSAVGLTEDNYDCTQRNGKYYLVKRADGFRLDLGAIAKGYAADECEAVLSRRGVESALINISGNLYLHGKWYREESGSYEDWAVGVTSPRPRGALLPETVCALRTDRAGAVVTSGDYQRYYRCVSGDRAITVAHILDGATGLPVDIGYDETAGVYYNRSERAAETGGACDSVISATVLAPSAMDADAYATALCVMGYEKAKAFLLSRSLSGVVISADGRMALVGIGDKDTGTGVSLTQQDTFDGFRQYVLETVR